LYPTLLQTQHTLTEATRLLESFPRDEWGTFDNPHYWEQFSKVRAAWVLFDRAYHVAAQSSVIDPLPTLEEIRHQRLAEAERDYARQSSLPPPPPPGVMAPSICIGLSSAMPIPYQPIFS